MRSRIKVKEPERLTLEAIASGAIDYMIDCSKGQRNNRERNIARAANVANHVLFSLSSSPMSTIEIVNGVKLSYIYAHSHSNTSIHFQPPGILTAVVRGVFIVHLLNELEITHVPIRENDGGLGHFTKLRNAIESTISDKQAIGKYGTDLIRTITSNGTKLPGAVTSIDYLPRIVSALRSEGTPVEALKRLDIRTQEMLAAKIKAEGDLRRVRPMYTFLRYLKNDRKDDYVDN
ncbi:MAG TPA: hypothetical protein VMV00_02195 [Candidatus Baltobacteraceae bacterium]|nr:hypothetical protein [Candidatus Baltobacteraceae bacterium]